MRRILLLVALLMPAPLVAQELPASTRMISARVVREVKEEIQGVQTQEFLECVAGVNFLDIFPGVFQAAKDGVVLRLDVELPETKKLFWYLAYTRKLGAVVLYAEQDFTATGENYQRQLVLMREMEAEIKARVPDLPVGITTSTARAYRKVWNEVGWTPDFLAVYGISGYDGQYERVQGFFPGQQLMVAEFSGPLTERWPELITKLKALGYIGIVLYERSR